MAQIDTSELMLDPDFVDGLTLVHRQSVVGTDGLNQVLEDCVATVGSVQPASGRDLQRLPDDLRVGDIRSFWIKAEIIADASCAYPDLIRFGNKTFSILQAWDWQNWGEGWSKGLCVGVKPAG